DGNWTSLLYEVPIVDVHGRYEVGGLPPGDYRVTLVAFDIGAYKPLWDGPGFTLAKDNPQPARVDVEVEAAELYHGRATYADGTPAYPGVVSAIIERIPNELRGTNCGLERDGSFRIALLRKEREDFLKKTPGLVEIQVYRQEGRQVHLDKVGEV